MFNALTLLSAALLATTSVVAKPCVVFDAGWNLYAFGAQGSNDWNLGLQSSWTASGSVTAVSKTNAPPFDGPNTQCYLSQFNNAIYVINGDASNPLNVHIFDPTAQAWSVQATTAGGVDPTSVQAILDHDTNVFFGLSGGSLYQLDFSSIKATGSGAALPWTAVESPPFSYGSVTPAMAIADNHIFFLGVPANTAGEASIFVIHYAYFQPEVQELTAASGFKTFPAIGGNVTSLWQTSGVQQTFAFFPSDGSDTYVVDVMTNTTYSLAAPPNAATASQAFAGSMTSLVQLTATGEIYYATLDQTDLGSTAQSASWSKIANNLWSASSSSSSSSSSSAYVAPGTTTTASASSTATTSAASAYNSSTASGSISSKNPVTVLGVLSTIVVAVLGLAAM